MSIAIGDRLSMMMEMMIPQVCFAGLQSAECSFGREKMDDGEFVDRDRHRQTENGQTDRLMPAHMAGQILYTVKPVICTV